MLEDPRGRDRIAGIVRAAASEPRAAAIIRELAGRDLVGPVERTLDVEDAALRANLLGSQVVGLVMARYVVGVEPLASLDPDALVAAIGPTLQRYLAEPLGLPDGQAAEVNMSA